MNWYEKMKATSRTLETACGPALVTSETSLALAAGWTELTYQANNGLRVWYESSLSCESFEGAVTVVVNGSCDVVVFDDLTGERLGCFRAVDLSALTPADIGAPGIKAVLDGSRSTMFIH